MKLKTLKRNSRRTNSRPLVCSTSIKPAGRPQSAASGSQLKLRTIVVPIDFSAASKKALPYATKLASKFGATLKLVHVVERIPFPYDIPMTRSDQEVAKESKVKLQALAKDEVNEMVPVQTGVRTGNPYREIVSFARMTDADLIVISTHGYTGLKHTLLGSTAERVVRYATCPVLVVREPRKEQL